MKSQDKEIFEIVVKHGLWFIYRLNRNNKYREDDKNVYNLLISDIKNPVKVTGFFLAYECNGLLMSLKISV